LSSGSDDEGELRQELDAAWRSLVRRLIETGHPPAVVVETMFEAAAHEFADLHGGTATANYLQLLASQVLVNETHRADGLIQG
jgi:hypothetical protein